MPDARAIRLTIAGFKPLPSLTLAEALNRYEADDVVDLDAVRKAWQEEAARVLIGRLND